MRDVSTAIAPSSDTGSKWSMRAAGRRGLVEVVPARQPVEVLVEAAPELAQPVDASCSAGRGGRRGAGQVGQSRSDPRRSPRDPDERRGPVSATVGSGEARVGASTAFPPRSPVFRILTALRRGVRPRTRAIVSVFQARPANAAHGHRGSRWSRRSGNGVRPLVAGCCHRFRHDRACGEANGLARPSHASVSPQT